MSLEINICDGYQLIFDWKGDSTKSELTGASSESDMDPSNLSSVKSEGNAGRKRCDRQKTTSLKISALAYESFEDGHKSAFLPYKV